MNKSPGRDIQVLTYILRNQMQIKSVMKDFNCDFSQTSKSVIHNKYAFDLCSMYMAQIGENVKILSDYSKERMGDIVNVDVLKYFRNMIDHDYEKVNKVYLQSYIQVMQSEKAIEKIKDLIKDCNEKKGND